MSKPTVRASTDGRAPAAPPGKGEQAGSAGKPLRRSETVQIAALCVAAFIFRMIFIRLVGHATDISTFENWMLTLAQYGPMGFYAHVQFIDYPPGYMLILWGAAGLNALLAPLTKHGIDTLIIAVKMPAILADVGLVYLTYLIMRRNWSTATALLGAAIIAVLNPDILFLSAYWGQADSVAVLFLVWAIYLALTDYQPASPPTLQVAKFIFALLCGLLGAFAWTRFGPALGFAGESAAVARFLAFGLPVVAGLLCYVAGFAVSPSVTRAFDSLWRYRFAWAWALLAFAVLIKPHPIAVAPLLLLWQIRRQGVTWRLAMIPVIGLAVAYVGSVLFAANRSPLALFQWLYTTYQHGRDGYPYNSVNAFNLYSVKNDFWQSDLLPVTLFGVHLGPLWAWGIAIFVGFLIAIALRQWRTTAPDASREDRENSFLFACFLVMLGYFMLLTRMHERYLFSAIVLIVLIRPLGSVQRIVTLALASTFIVDLFYGLYYLKTPSVDLNPVLVHSLSFINVLCFFAVAGVYLIEELDSSVKAWFTRPLEKKVPRLSPQLLEGLIGFTRLDWWLTAGLTAATAFLLIYRIAQPHERIFDEIYYARSAQEYLQHQDVFEWTHPPLPKLCMAATSWFFQKALPAIGVWLSGNGIAFGAFLVKNQIGDPVSSRIACAIAGTCTVPVLYAFAKRLFASTGAAVVAVVLLMSSGFFFVQARTALPDVFVALFSLSALYCGYRFFMSGQIVRRAGGAYPDWPSIWATVGVFVALVAFVALEVIYYDPSKHPPGISWMIFLAFMALLTAFCLLWARRLASERTGGHTAVYPDGTVVEGTAVTFPSGEQRTLKGASFNDGTQKATWGSDGVALSEGDVAVRWQADGAIRGNAAGRTFLDKQQWAPWLILTGLTLGAVTACKWYGIFDFGTIMLAAVLVTLQGFLPAYWRWRDQGAKLDQPRRLLWGNPLGWHLPLLLAGIVLLGFAFYALTYIPYFSLGRTFQDMLNMQHSMYAYHHDLKATHVYGSPWWWWPLDIRPVAYYYHGFSKPGNPVQIIAEVTALPNPAVWLAGLITIPLAGLLAWRERHKGMLIVVAASFLHWLPWAGSPRVDFQYNIYNNTALVCLCSAYALYRLWRWAQASAQSEPNRQLAVRVGAAAYLAVCIGMFVYFYPILGAVPITYQDWQAHMWLNGGCQSGQKQDCLGWI